ncbi:MAG: hypothetical protein JW741_03235 [Sedimentisphaerales bacterium]|nr:hypothetical protein [Sedimentisphaerales bacterium]
MAVSRRVAALCGSAGVALFALSGTAFAEDKFAWSATLTGTSDYVFRGISQTENDPTIQGSLGATYGLFYAGIWASGVDFNDDAQIEADYYVGFKPTWDKFSFDFGVIYYDYPGYDAPNNEALELKAGVSTTIQNLALGAIYYYSPGYNDKEYGVVELSAGYTLPTFFVFTPSVTAVYGNQHDLGGDIELPDYNYWNAGLVLTVDKLAFDFRYWDTDFDSGVCGGIIPSTCDERFVFSATLSLP